MRSSDHKNRTAKRGYVVSGGMLKLPKTPVERTMLTVLQRRLKREFYRRQEGSDR